MSEEEFLNRLLNKIAKNFGYDVANTLQLMFIKKEKQVEQLETIRNEAIEYIKSDSYFDGSSICANDLLNILNKGSDKE